MKHLFLLLFIPFLLVSCKTTELTSGIIGRFNSDIPENQKELEEQKKKEQEQKKAIERLYNEPVFLEKTYTHTSSKNIKLARLWVAETYNSSKAVVDFYDEELNTLVGKAIWRFSDGKDLIKEDFEFPTSISYKFKVSTKGNNLTIKFDDFHYTHISNKYINKKTQNRELFYLYLDEVSKSLFDFYDNN